MGSSTRGSQEEERKEDDDFGKDYLQNSDTLQALFCIYNVPAIHVRAASLSILLASNGL
jgi:hypothetical protein